MTGVLRALATLLPRRLRHIARSPGLEWNTLWARLSFLVFGPDIIEVRPGWTVRCHPATSLAFRQSRDEPSLTHELDRFVSTCHAGLQLVDVGSHYGVFTLAALHYGGPHAHVVAVDPSPQTHVFLAINLELNQVEPQVTRVQAALSAAPGSFAMLTHGAQQAFQMIGASAGRSDAHQVVATTLDLVAAELPRPVTHIKIDVEGHEREVLLGGIHTLTTHQPFLALELHNNLLAHRGESGRPILEMIEQLGYLWECADPADRAKSTDEILKLWLVRLSCRPAGDSN